MGAGLIIGPSKTATLHARGRIYYFFHSTQPFYGLAEITNHITILSYLMKAFEVTFFLIAVFACPIGFLVGVIGSLILLIRERKKEEEVKGVFRDKDR